MIKKEWNYEAYKENFRGKFFGSYCFFPDIQGCTERYKAKKYTDMIDDAKEREESLTRGDLEILFKKGLVPRLKELVDKKRILVKEAIKVLGIAYSTWEDWCREQGLNDKETIINVSKIVESNEKIPILLKN